MVLRIMETPQLPLYTVVYVPVMQVVQVLDIPFVPQMLILMVQYILQFLEIPQFAVRFFWWPMSLLCMLCRFSGSAVEKTFVLPQLQLAEKIVPAENCNSSAVAVRYGRSHPCRGAVAFSHGLADHGDSPVARGHGGRSPVPQVPSWRRQSSPTVALVERLDALRPLRVWALLGAAKKRGDELRWGIF